MPADANLPSVRSTAASSSGQALRTKHDTISSGPYHRSISRTRSVTVVRLPSAWLSCPPTTAHHEPASVPRPRTRPAPPIARVAPRPRTCDGPQAPRSASVHRCSADIAHRRSHGNPCQMRSGAYPMSWSSPAGTSTLSLPTTGTACRARSATPWTCAQRRGNDSASASPAKRYAQASRSTPTA